FQVRQEQAARIGRRKTTVSQVGKYRRGLIEQFVVGGPFPLTAQLDLPWDKVLSVKLSVVRPVEEGLLAEILQQPCANRIVAIDFWEVPVTEAIVRLFVGCRQLVNLHSFLAFGCRVHLRGFTDLVTSPAVRSWDVLQVVGDFVGPRNRVLTEVDPPSLVESL